MTRGTDRPATAAATATVLDEMISLYERARAMAEEAARSEDGAGVLDALRKRQALVDALSALDASFRGADPSAPAAGLGGTDQERAALERKVAAAATAARRLADADAALGESLRARRDALVGELAALGRSSGAHAAYAQPSRTGGARLRDTEG